MAQGYYTLQEAAQYLAMSVDELKQLAQKGKIRSFQDRGTLRFRVQDVQELARERGTTSDPDQVLGDASLPAPKSSSTPPSAAKKSPKSPKTPAKQSGVPEVFAFDMGEDVNIGADVVLPSGSSKSKPPSSKGKKVPSPQPQSAGTDSDVRLVSDGSDVTFSVPRDSDAKLPDSDVRVSPDPLKPKTGIHTPPPGSGAKKPGSSKTKKADISSDVAHPSPKPGSAPSPVDSGVRLVPLDSDSDVKLHGSSDEVPLGESAPPAASDSNVRLERVDLPSADSQEGAMMLTEEINLDEEIKKQQEADQDKPKTKVKAKSSEPAPSPFELSETDLDMPVELKDGAGPKTPVKAEGEDSSDFELNAQRDGSSDFDLVPAEDGSIQLEGDSSDFSLEASDDSEEVLQEERTELTSSSSGISLDNPVDAGISLEEGVDGSSSDFDLSLDVGATPKPARSDPVGETGSSEFELTLDSDAESPAPSEDSEFELSLEGSGESPGSSDSEFELTLDDSGEGVATAEPPQVKSKKKAPAGEEQDIFDTDFEVPALDESDEATVADSELESSDFDLALDDSELAQEEESGSQVVALDEEEGAAETVADEDAAGDVEVDEESSDFADLDQDVEVETEGEVEVEAGGKVREKIVIQEKLIPPAPWGVLPVVFMLPCVIIMFLVGLLGYELVQTSAGLRPPGPLTVAIYESMGQKISASAK
jgi:excisionase family DNA binding protein